MFTLIACALLTSPLAVPYQSLYKSLDPLSVAQHLSFYELYPDTPEGKQALQRAWELLEGGKLHLHDALTLLPRFDIQSIIALITRQSNAPQVTLSESQLTLIEKISQRLNNRKLKGFNSWTAQELQALKPEEIDLGRGILIHQFDDRQQVRQYEASMDLMALQILARLSPHSTHEDKIREINRFIFQEMQFRFPPHSLYAKDIDLYTFLPSVLDNRQGVCLGVSILYLCLAQRLDLPLEIITPPGHIYVRYRTPEKTINIETTARGINTPSDTYLGINTRKLIQRNIKEVIGFAFVNQASVFWAKEDYKTTVMLYEKALPYLPDDSLLKMLLGLNYLFIGEKSKGKKLLDDIRNTVAEDAVVKDVTAEDYLGGKVDVEGLKAIFLPVDETRDSILGKQKELQKILKRYPQFRGGLLQYAVTYLQLGRSLEAQQILQKYHQLDPTNPTVEYYLSIISLERLDYNLSWDYLKQAEKIVHTRGHHPKALKAIRDTLRSTSPEI